MKLNTKEFKQVCAKILTALDNSTTSTITDKLELNALDNELNLSVTNGEYYVTVKFPLNSQEEFKATVDATVFLKLISQTTSEELDLTLDFNSLKIKGNGNYKLPLIFENDKIMELPKISIINKTLTTQIPKQHLEDIANYNSKEIIKENISKPIQKMFYLDHQGCITFTGTGACINTFKLNTPFKILLNSKLVKLFKLFKSDVVFMDLGYDALNNNLIQTKVSFYNNDITLTSILSCDDTLLNSVPVAAIRNKLTINYPYTSVLNKNELSQALNRLLLFTKPSIGTFNNYYKFTFTPSNVIISDPNDINSETLNYQNGSNINITYETNLNINELKTLLESYTDNYVTILFGNKSSCIITRNNIKNILMEYIKDNE